jgi:uncharacterized damage-inducible protein DinB
VNTGSAAIVASSLTWEQAHATIDNALKGLPPKLRGVRPDKFPHSVWQLVEHVRLAQHDLLAFCVNAEYEETLKWPDDYWPSAPAPASEAEWNRSLDAIRRDAAAFAKFATEHAATLEQKIPHGTGQTYLRTILVAVDHASYHVGQIVAVRRLLGAWR